MALTLIVGGREVSEDEARAQLADRKPKAPPMKPEKKHHGFIVVGHQESKVQAAKIEAERRRARGSRTSKAPPMWDEESWLRTNRPKQISKVFSTPAAADEFAALARRSGFVHVSSVEKITGG